MILTISFTTVAYIAMWSGIIGICIGVAIGRGIK